MMQKKKQSSQKIYILDSNVLVHEPMALFAFENTLVGIPSIVLEELDAFKREGTDRGRNSREVTRQLDALRERGSLGDGVKLDNGSTLQVLFLSSKKMPAMPFDINIKENAILLTALSLQEQGYQVRFISKDINARVKADALGMAAQDYLKEHVTQDEFYKGWVTIKAPAVQLKKQFPEQLLSFAHEYALTRNEFVLVESNNNPFNYRIFRHLGNNSFKAIHPPSIKWPLQPRNPQQLMALDLLLDDSLPFITLLGPAGTGKTFLALLAGLYKVLVDDVFEKMLISRPVVPLGRDIGYLPGDIKEKLHSWMLPIYDNMEFIIHEINVRQHFNELEQEQRGKKKPKNEASPRRKRKTELETIEDLVNRGKLSMEAITYMRGRSIPYQYILIDEAQNLTPHEVKAIVTRVGEGSKIILAGDPYQIDSPYLDFSSNGLVLASERFKGQELFGSVFLETSERSELSKLAGELF